MSAYYMYMALWRSPFKLYLFPYDVLAIATKLHEYGVLVAAK